MYNICFTGAIIGAIMIFINAIGDTQILLVIFLFLWLIYCTFGFMFVPKFVQVYQSRKENSMKGTDGNNNSTDGNGAGANSRISGVSADGSMEFSFASFADIPAGQLLNYSQALEQQLIKVKARI